MKLAVAAVISRVMAMRGKMATSLITYLLIGETVALAA
jgi:hypothetical protein